MCFVIAYYVPVQNLEELAEKSTINVGCMDPIRCQLLDQLFAFVAEKGDELIATMPVTSGRKTPTPSFGVVTETGCQWFKASAEHMRFGRLSSHN